LGRILRAAPNARQALDSRSQAHLLLLTSHSYSDGVKSEAGRIVGFQGVIEPKSGANPQKSHTLRIDELIAG
jgi:hypothetical protein